MSSKLRSSLIQLVIGGILLTISYRYVVAHPAEQFGLMSTLTVVVEKVQTIYNRIIGEDDDQTVDHQMMLSQYDEMITTLRNSNCPTSSSGLPDIDQTRQTLTSLSPTVFATQKANYLTILTQYYEWINTNCKA